MPKPFPMLDKAIHPLIVTHGPTGLVAKFSLLLVLALVQTGNERPGFRLLTGFFLAHFLVGAYTVSGIEGGGKLVALASLVLAGAAAWSLARESVRWKVLPDEQPALALAVVGYVIAFWFPLWPGQGPGRAIFFSPMGAIPHQTLVVLLVLSAASGAAGSVVLRRTGLAAAVVIGLVELFAGSGLRAGVLLVAAASSGLLPMLQGLIQRRGVEQPEEAPSRQRPVPTAAPEKKEAPPEAPKRKWDLR